MEYVNDLLKSISPEYTIVIWVMIANLMLWSKDSKLCPFNTIGNNLKQKIGIYLLSSIFAILVLSYVIIVLIEIDTLNMSAFKQSMIILPMILGFQRCDMATFFKYIKNKMTGGKES